MGGGHVKVHACGGPCQIFFGRREGGVEVFLGRGQRKCKRRIATNSRCNLKRVPKTMRAALHFAVLGGLFFFTLFCIGLHLDFWEVQNDANRSCRIALRSQPHTHTFVSSTSTGKPQPRNRLGMSRWSQTSSSNYGNWAHEELQHTGVSSSCAEHSGDITVSRLPVSHECIPGKSLIYFICLKVVAV